MRTKFSFGKREGKRPLGRARRIWEDKNKMNVSKMGMDGAYRINLAEYGADCMLS